MTGLCIILNHCIACYIVMHFYNFFYRHTDIVDFVDQGGGQFEIIKTLKTCLFLLSTKRVINKK